MSERPLRDLITRLEELHLVVTPVSTDVSITSAPTHDSRLVTTGGIFVAIPGRIADGATFIASAAERGAVAVLCEQQIASSVPLIVIRDARAALAAAAAWWEGDPAEGLIAIGVTGTDGKTTTSTFLSTALTAAGLRTGLISTAISRVGGTQRAAAAHQTTPEAPALQRALREMVEAGDEAAVVESTSHGLQLERVGAINFASAIYTTFSPDHLDFHATLDEYRAAKAKLVARTVGSAASRARQLPRVVVVHASDPAVQPFADAAVGAHDSLRRGRGGWVAGRSIRCLLGSRGAHQRSEGRVASQHAWSNQCRECGCSTHPCRCMGPATPRSDRRG